MDKRRVNVRAIIMRGDKMLAVKHREDDGTEQPYWATPGGGLDPMETLQDGVKREVMEELGVEAVVKQLLFIQQFPSGREGFDEELELFFLVEDSPLFDAIKLSDTTHGALELSRVEFIDPGKVDIKPSFLSHVKLQEYVTGKHEPYIYSGLSS